MKGREKTPVRAVPGYLKSEMTATVHFSTAYKYLLMKAVVRTVAGTNDRRCQEGVGSA